MKTSLLSKFGFCLLLAPIATFAETALTDANIAAIVVAANNIDIKAGKLAQETSANTDVKGLGEMMVRDHEGVNQQAVALVTKLHVTPEDNDSSKQLKAGAEITYDGLKAKKGADFDRAYVANEIGYHQAVISLVETTLIPSAKNAELKALLQAVLPALKAHLAHAQHVQTQLK